MLQEDRKVNGWKPCKFELSLWKDEANWWPQRCNFGPLEADVEVAFLASSIVLHDEVLCTPLDTTSEIGSFEYEIGITQKFKSFGLNFAKDLDNRMYFIFYFDVTQSKFLNEWITKF